MNCATKLMGAQCLKDPADDSQHLVIWQRTHPKTSIIRGYKDANSRYFSNWTIKLHSYMSYQLLSCNKRFSSSLAKCLYIHWDKGTSRQQSGYVTGVVWGDKECLCLGELERHLDGGLYPCTQGDKPQPLHSPTSTVLAKYCWWWRSRSSRRTAGLLCPHEYGKSREIHLTPTPASLYVIHMTYESLCMVARQER